MTQLTSDPQGPVPSADHGRPEDREQIAPRSVPAGTQVPDTTFEIDRVQALDPSKFPNRPQGYGRPPCTLPNMQHLLREYGITVRYDVIKKKLRVTIPGLAGQTDNADNTAITTIISLATLNGMNVTQVAAMLDAIGDRNPYNPVATWITARPWDGKDRLPEIYATLTTREGFPVHLKERLIYRWLLSATAAAMLPTGFHNRGVLVLQGDQGIGKTSWFTALVNDTTLRADVIKVDHLLDPLNKDTIIGAITHWIVELGELDGALRKVDIARLKGVISNRHDKVRRPYAKTESEYPRRTTFCASVNDPNFLVDATGNTRFWVLPVTAINYTHGIDMQQVFAQLAVDVEAGEQWWLTPPEEDLLEHQNREHRTVSAMRERLMPMLDLEHVGESGHPSMGTIELLKHLGYERPTNGDAKEMTGLLRELLGPSKKVRGTETWRIPFRKGVGPVTFDSDDPEQY